MRQTVLGKETPKDSQGSLILETMLARKLAEASDFENYMFSLDIATQALDQGVSVVELPIYLKNHTGPSSVSVIKDGYKMVWDLFKMSKQRSRDLNPYRHKPLPPQFKASTTQSNSA